ncbi:unnamed protein product [Orchesella dallaii]|uniref:C2H2-type domain-containing protein n=1 Tax=Orchesella dallaii TaxID=48710 RepID=A0ABP1S043_9HEXA
MGKRGKGLKTDDKNRGKETQLSTDDSAPSKKVLETVVVKSCVVTIDHNCWLLAEEALHKIGTSRSVCGHTIAESPKPIDGSKAVKTVSLKSELKKKLKIKKREKFCRKASKTSSSSLRRSPRKLSDNPKTKGSVVRRRQETLKKVSRALGSVRRHCAPSKNLNSVLPRRKSLRIRKKKSTQKSKLPSLNPKRNHKQSLSINGKTMERRDRDELNGSNCDDSSNQDINHHDDAPGVEDLLKDDSDDDPPMQVLERQDQIDDEEEEEDDAGDISLNLANDTDEESLLLSPSALPASSLFRSPSRKKSSDRKRQRQQSAEKFESSRFHTPERSPSPVPSTSSVSSSRRKEKRGRGRPRKPIEDVKSVTGKLYRKKLADRLLEAHNSNQEPRAHSSSSALTFSQSVLASNFEDADEEDEELLDDDDDGTPNSASKLKRWDNKSTFVYAKHKFVSNENKFRCDTCQVSFTALSSLKRHYGTIYHKQQEAAGGSSTLDLSDILRPDRQNEMPSTSAAAGLNLMPYSDPSPSSSLINNRRSHGRSRPGEQARTSSFVRRNAVDSIKKKYNAAADARRRKENSSMATSTITSWYQTQQKKKKQLSASNTTINWYMDDSSDDEGLIMEPCDEEDIENNFPNDISEDMFTEPKVWLSNSWKGNGVPHFSCEVCGESFAKKLEFTAHLFSHRQEEQRNEFFTCADCDTNCGDEKSLSFHCRLFLHSGSIVEARSRKYPCQKCGSIFPRREYYQKHVLTHRRPVFVCPHCSKKFEYKFYLGDHIKADHEGCVNIVPTVNGKPKVELLGTASLQLMAENSNTNMASETEGIPASVTNHRNSDLSTKKESVKSETKNVPEFITCEENGDESSRCSGTSREPPVSPTSQDGLSIMEKFLESQQGGDHTLSDSFAISEPESSEEYKHLGNGAGNHVLNGSITTDNGKQIVIQFEPNKKPIVSEDILDGAETGTDSNVIFSPLTIEIPRDTSSDKDGPEAEDFNEMLTINSTDSAKKVVRKPRTPIANDSLIGNITIQPVGLLGCGVKTMLLEKVPENSLTCQDCGKSFEHRKSLVKHVLYYRQNEKYSCQICSKSFRLKHHVSRHMKSFHNIDTNSTTSSTSGDQQGDGEELDLMISPGGSSGGLLAIPGTSKEVSGTSSGSSFTRQFTSGSGEDIRKRKFSSVKSALTKMRGMKGVRSKSSTATSTAAGSFENGDGGAKKRCVVQRGSTIDTPTPSSVSSSSTRKKMPGMLPIASSSTSVRDRGNELNPLVTYTTVFDSNGATAYKCLVCKKLYPSMFRLNSHSWFHTRPLKYRCNVCGAEFRFKHDLNAHKQVHKSDRIKFSCDKCPKAFSWRKDLLKHTRTKHNDDGAAVTSSATFSGGSSLSLLDDTLSRCPFCPLVFPQDGDLLNTHIKVSHGKCCVCRHCGQVLGSQELLDDHIEHEHEESHPPTPSPHPSPINMMDDFNDEPDEDELEQSPSSPEFELPELN